jgi:hypothetical protein
MSSVAINNRNGNNLYDLPRKNGGNSAAVKVKKECRIDVDIVKPGLPSNVTTCPDAQADQDDLKEKFNAAIKTFNDAGKLQGNFTLDSTSNNTKPDRVDLSNTAASGDKDK